MDLFSLTGRTALVTGGTRGIGQQMAIAMAEAGADIILVQVNRDLLPAKQQQVQRSNSPGMQRNTSNQDTRQNIEDLGRKAMIYTADLASRESVSTLVSNVLNDGHDIDILLNCAGIQRRHASHVFPDNDWDEVLYSHVTKG